MLELKSFTVLIPTPASLFYRLTDKWLLPKLHFIFFVTGFSLFMYVCLFQKWVLFFQSLHPRDRLSLGKCSIFYIRKLALVSENSEQEYYV